MYCKNYIHLLPTIKLYPSNTLSGPTVTKWAVSTHLSFIILIKWWLDDEQAGYHHHPPPRPFGTAFISGSWMGPPWCLILRGCWLSGLIEILYLFAIQNWPLSQINPPIEPPSPHLPSPLASLYYNPPPSSNRISFYFAIVNFKIGPSPYCKPPLTPLPPPLFIIQCSQNTQDCFYWCLIFIKSLQLKLNKIPFFSQMYIVH